MVELVWILERSYKYSRNELTAAVMGLVSAVEVQVETARDVAEILPLYRNEGFGFSNLMIRQAAKLAGVTLIGTSH